MLKTNKSKKNVVILALSVMLAIAALFGATAAWFIADASATGAVSTGTIDVTLTVGSQTFTDGEGTINPVENAVAGDTLIGAISITPDVSGLVGGAYARIKIETEDDATLTLNIVAKAGWNLGDDGWYYYGQQGACTKIESNTAIAFSDAVALANNSNDQGLSTEITVTAELVQAKNNTNCSFANA